MESKKLNTHRNLLLLSLDTTLLVSFWLVNQVKQTGIVFHEWFGVALGLILLFHLGLHWKWVVNMFRRFFTVHNLIQHVKLILDITALVSFFTIIITGILMSKSFLPTLGLTSMHSFTLKMLHVTSTRITIYLVAAHLLLNLKWIFKVISRFISKPGKPAGHEMLQLQ